MRCLRDKNIKNEADENDCICDLTVTESLAVCVSSTSQTADINIYLALDCVHIQVYLPTANYVVSFKHVKHVNPIQPFDNQLSSRSYEMIMITLRALVSKLDHTSLI